MRLDAHLRFRRRRLREAIFACCGNGFPALRRRAPLTLALRGVV
jgi:hypothetical protein